MGNGMPIKPTVYICGEKPTVYIKDGLDIKHTLRYNFPSWLTQKEKGTVAHPCEAVMSKGVQAIMSVSLFAHPPYIASVSIGKIFIVSTLLSEGFSHLLPSLAVLLNR